MQPDNVIITAIKKAEDDDSLIVRFYEWSGNATDVKLQAPGAEQASEADLMEKPSASLPLENEVVTVHTGPFEIKTVRLRFASRPASAHLQP